jgi:hypothetical protein
MTNMVRGMDSGTSPRMTGFYGIADSFRRIKKWQLI